MKVAYRAGAQVYTLSIEVSPPGFRVTLDGQVHTVKLVQAEAGLFHLEIDGRSVTAHWAADGPVRWVAVGGRTFLLDKRISRAAAAAGQGGDERVLRAPMPGQVRAVQVAVGEAVSKGQTLLVLEAMKMEIRLQAPCDGQVARLPAAEGETVERGQVVVELV